eukprot:SAG11_NODE_7253_length_1172_cov_1.729730_1_plen_224_part_00
MRPLYSHYRQVGVVASDYLARARDQLFCRRSAVVLVRGEALLAERVHYCDGVLHLLQDVRGCRGAYCLSCLQPPRTVRHLGLKLLLRLLQPLYLHTLLLPLFETCVPFTAYGVRHQFEVLGRGLVDVVRLLEAINSVVLLCLYALLLRIVRCYLWSGQAADLPERVCVGDRRSLRAVDAAADGCEVRSSVLEVIADRLDGVASVKLLFLRSIIQSQVVSLVLT